MDGKELGLVVAQLELQRVIIDVAVDGGEHFLRHANPIVVALLPKRPRLARELVKVFRTEAFERADRPPERNKRICQPRAKMKLEVHMIRHHDEVKKSDARHLRHLGEPPLHGKPERRLLELGTHDLPE